MGRAGRAPNQTPHPHSACVPTGYIEANKRSSFLNHLGFAGGDPGTLGPGAAPGALEGRTGGIPSPGRPRGLAARRALANTSAIILSVSEVHPSGAGRVGGGLTPGAIATIL